MMNMIAKILRISLLAITSARVLSMDAPSYGRPLFIRTTNGRTSLQLTRSIEISNVANLVKHLALVNVIPYKLAPPTTQVVYPNDNAQIVTNSTDAAQNIVHINNRINEGTRKNNLTNNDYSYKDIQYHKNDITKDSSVNSEDLTSTEGVSTVTEDYETTTYLMDLDNRAGVDTHVVATLLGR